MPLDLATVKLHLRVTHDAEDALIELYLAASQESAAMFLYRNVYLTPEALAAAILDGDLTGILTNSAIDAAVLLMVGHLYSNREDVVAGVSIAQLPNGSQSLLWPYRAGLGV